MEPRPLPARSRTIGRATVIALEDSAGRFFRPRGEAFPGATGEHWARADALDPGAVDGGWWWLRFRCYAIRFERGGTVLVDAGVGPAGSPASGWAPVPGRLPEELAGAGIDPVDVATVVLTHLHDDHVGWAVTGGRPYFPNARYVLQRVERDLAGGTVRRTVVEPLLAAGQLALVDGDARLAAGLRVVHTPGHTPGHQAVLLESGDRTVALTGDVLVHAAQLADPGLGYAYESDPAAARTTRTALLAELTARRATLATAHLSEPFLVLPLAGNG
jgi:glyoxylase-like metal-dependent hydrolase (beta-lactamase superfamily II)